jgi:hypothetical protein
MYGQLTSYDLEKIDAGSEELGSWGSEGLASCSTCAFDDIRPLRVSVIVEVMHLINPTNKRGETLFSLLEEASPGLVNPAPVAGPRNYAQVLAPEDQVDYIRGLLRDIGKKRGKSRKVQLKVLDAYYFESDSE